MDLDRCTSAQREVVTTLDAPLMVAAGAGSGKTFTLIQRIAYALLPDEQGTCYLSSVGEVCAITFTKRAAAELKSRLKALLTDEGMLDQALAVDDAWISTIHAMAARILREQALELGLDPSFEVLSESDVDELRNEAVEQVMGEIRRGDEALSHMLFDDEDSPAPRVRGGAVDVALRIVKCARSMPDGFDALKLSAPSCSPQELLRELYEQGRSLRESASMWDAPGKTEQKVIDDLDAALDQASAYLKRDDIANASFEDGAFDADEFRCVFYAFPPTSPKFHEKKDDADLLATYRSEYARLSEEVEAGIVWPRTCALVRLARAIDARFSEIKGPSRLDNDDLLMRCYQALSSNPEMAARYRDRFKLIMIDEFQDTDNLQAALIGLLAQPDWGNVCTVGDAQQSIYRFRGADVEVFFSFRENLCAQNPQARTVSLPDNFRSHADVLALVDAVFSQDQAFGDAFLHLEPRAAINDESDPVFEENPRLSIDVVHYARPSSSARGVTSVQARAVAAAHIAEHFAQLRTAGARAGDMVLLLGGMTHADIYASALREEGLECVIAGGSVFATTDEAVLVDDLLCLAVNASDEPALFAVLTSNLFALPDDVLLALSSQRSEDGSISLRSLSCGFADVHGGEDLGLSSQSEHAMALARRALEDFMCTAHERRASRALRDLFVETGLFDRLELMGADGLARAGNLAKAISLVETFERENTGISSIAQAYRNHLACSKESPGALATVGSDFVRIMTVHASKGLEFPHVAVAEVGTGDVNRERFYAEPVGDTAYIAMSTATTGDHGKVIGALRKFERLDDVTLPELAATPGEIHAALCAHVHRQSLAEARRVLYVAMTRASRSLMLSVCTNTNPKDAYEKAGIYRDVYTALQWDTTSDRSTSLIECGASAPVKVTFAYLRTLSPDDDELTDADTGAAAGDMADDETGKGVNDVAYDMADDGSAAAGSRSAAASDGTEGDRLQKPFTITCRPSAEQVNPVLSSAKPEDVCSYTSLLEGIGQLMQPHQDLPPLQDAQSPYDQPLSDTPQAPKFSLEEEMFDRDPDEVATDLGTAFHALSQRTVLRCNAMRSAGTPCALVAPDADEVRQVAHAHGLADAQQDRLVAACRRWFSSALAQRVAAYEKLYAEAPFMVALDAQRAHFYLEGVIDLLATNGDGIAVLIDYKTGGFAQETPADLHEKHLLQAQCYALALLDEGFDEVEAHFVRVEHPSSDDAHEPQIVDYHFAHDDLESLRDTVCTAWLQTRQDGTADNTGGQS